MQDEQVRAAVEAAVRAAGRKFMEAGVEDHIVSKAADEIMRVVREYASDEYSRGSSDGRFTESFYGMGGDF